MHSAARVESAFARRTIEIAYGDLETHVIEREKLSILDTLGVALAGSVTPTARKMAVYVLDASESSTAGIWGTARRAAARDAAFANAVSAHALDLDDVFATRGVHAHAVVVPAAFAAASLHGVAHGRDVVTAIAVGADVACRLASAAGALNEGWSPTAAFGAFGAAAAAARLLRLDAERTRDALGIALAFGAGPRQALLDGAGAKLLQCAIAARAGLEAALLARAGVTGARAFLSGPFGAYAMYGDGRWDADVLLDNRPLYGTASRVKRYPCCGSAQAPVAAALALVNAHGLRAADVASVSVTVPRGIAEQLGTPLNEAPSVVRAQVSLPYLVALAIARGRLTAADVDAAAIARGEDVVALARRCTVVADPGAAESDDLPVAVSLRTRDGRELRHAVGGEFADADGSGASVPGKVNALLGNAFGSRGSALADALASEVAALDARSSPAPLEALLGCT
jgi:2-methylcitrate dehydratase PrpD